VKAISGRFSVLLVRPAPRRALTAASWDRAGLFRRGRPSSPCSRVGASSSSSPSYVPKKGKAVILLSSLQIGESCQHSTNRKSGSGFRLKYIVRLVAPL
jgi:hypothetical protein